MPGYLVMPQSFRSARFRRKELINGQILGWMSFSISFKDSCPGKPVDLDVVNRRKDGLPKSANKIQVGSRRNSPEELG
jgi:hypothetical protein